MIFDVSYACMHLHPGLQQQVSIGYRVYGAAPLGGGPMGQGVSGGCLGGRRGWTVGEGRTDRSLMRRAIARHATASLLVRAGQLAHDGDGGGQQARVG